MGDVGPGGPDTGHGDAGGGGACTYGTGGCDLTDTSSCPPMGTTRQGCYPDMGAPACHPAGTAAAGASCTNLNDCDAGMVCLSTNTCERLCCSVSDCNPGEMCNPLGDGSGMPLPNGVGFCHRPTSCTVVPQSGCMATEACIVSAMDGSTDCINAGPTAEGGSCDSSACMAGLGCFTMGSGTPGMCYRFCRTAMGNADCTGSGATCMGVSILGTMYGLCM
jgi:hypothetical protein